MFVMYENMVKVSVGVMLISDITKQIEIYIGMAWQSSYITFLPPQPIPRLRESFMTASSTPTSERHGT